MKNSSASLAVLGIWVTLFVSAFGSTPTSISLSVLSLSGVFTILIALYFLLLFFVYPLFKSSVWFHFPYIVFVLLNAAWLAIGVSSLSLIQNFVVWSGMLLISMIVSSWAMNAPRLDRRIKFLEMLIPVSLVLFFLIMFIKVSRGGTDPATPIVGVVYAAYYIGKSVESRRDSAISFVLVLGILTLSILIGARIVSIAILVMVLYFLVQQKKYITSILFSAFIAAFGSILLLFYSEILGVNVGDNAIKVGQYSINSAGRSYAWALMIESIYNSPILGHGVDVAPELLGLTKWAHPHNDYLRLLHHSGILGMLLFVLFYVNVFRGIRRINLSNVTRIESRVLRTTSYGIIGIAVVMLTDNVITYSYVVYLLSFFIGLSIAIVVTSKHRSNTSGSIGFTDLSHRVKVGIKSSTVQRYNFS